MVDFSNFRSADITGKTAEYVIPGVTGAAPILTLKPATEENTPYFNAMLAKLSQADIQAYARAKNSSPAARKAQRDVFREILPAYVVTGWRGVVDAAGAAVAFDPGAAVALFAQLPDWVIDEIVGFAAERSNFFDVPAPGVVAGN